MFFRKKRGHFDKNSVLPPSNTCERVKNSQNERMSLCVLKKGSLTVEAAWILPFILMILLAFFSFFLQYASAAELQLQAAAEAKKIGIAAGDLGIDYRADITIRKSMTLEDLWIMPFQKEPQMTQKAVCRAWVGFTGLKTGEIYVYATPEGAVYHLQNDCTHLKLSIECTALEQAKQEYRKCQHCKEAFGALVYVTKEGECYHSERSCIGLKRTVRKVLLSSVTDRSCCLRCMERGE